MFVTFKILNSKKKKSMVLDSQNKKIVFGAKPFLARDISRI